jgi:rhombotail lipoprotein
MHRSRNPFVRFLIAMLAIALLGGCASHSVRKRQAASVVEYLYPASQPPQPLDTITQLKLPVRVGIAFVPAGRVGVRHIPQAERSEMLSRVKASFADRPFIAQIEVIPDAYLRPAGGFDNLDQVARMFQLDVVCLLSYDQVQYADDNAAALLYWTIVGAYVIPATKFSTHTMLDAAVFDVRSRRLLFRAPGVSHSDARRAPLVASEYTRKSLGEGFDRALDAMIPALHGELDRFRERVRNGDAQVKVAYPAGARMVGALALVHGMVALAGVPAQPGCPKVLPWPGPSTWRAPPLDSSLRTAGGARGPTASNPSKDIPWASSARSSTSCAITRLPIPPRAAPAAPRRVRSGLPPEARRPRVAAPRPPSRTSTSRPC